MTDPKRMADANEESNSELLKRVACGVADAWLTYVGPPLPIPIVDQLEAAELVTRNSPFRRVQL